MNVFLSRVSDPVCQGAAPFRWYTVRLLTVHLVLCVLLSHPLWKPVYTLRIHMGASAAVTQNEGKIGVVLLFHFSTSPFVYGDFPVPYCARVQRPFSLVDRTVEFGVLLSSGSSGLLTRLCHGRGTVVLMSTYNSTMLPRPSKRGGGRMGARERGGVILAPLCNYVFHV